MTPDKLIVSLVGIGSIAFIVWFFWLVKKPRIAANKTADGYQEVLVTVKGGYTPNVILVEKGKPVRLNFLRGESAACSDTVVFPDFAKSARLPEGKTVTVELMPQNSGEFDFQCPMGMIRGKLVVE